MASQTKTYLRELIDFDGNVFILGQERAYNTGEDSDEEIPAYIYVASTPSVSGWIAPAVDYNVRTFLRPKVIVTQKKIGGKTTTVRKPTEEIEYCLLMGPDQLYFTKFRCPLNSDLPKVMVDPTYEKLKPFLG